MRIIKLILFCIALCFLVSATYGQAVVNFGATRPQDTGITKGQLRAPAYSNSDPTKFLTVTSTGLIVLGTPSGGSTIDTTSLSNRINARVKYTDTASMLLSYLRKADTATLSNRINLKLNISDTSAMLLPYLRKSDTSTLSNRINLKLNISDTASMLSTYLRSVLGVKYTDTGAMLVPYLRKADTAHITPLLAGKLDTNQSAFNQKLLQVIPTSGDIPINIEGEVSKIEANATATPQFLQSVNGEVMYAPINLPGYLTFYLQNSASGISSYKQMVNALCPDNEQYVSIVNPANNAIVQRWITDVGLPNLQFIPAGTYGVHFHAYRTGGDTTAITQLYSEIYKRDTNGTETLIATTDVTNPLTGAELQWTITVDKEVAANLNRSDRIVMYIRAVVFTPDPALTIHIGFCGTTNSRVELPTPAVDASNFVPYTGAVYDLDMGDHSVTADTFISGTPLVYSPEFLDSLQAVHIWANSRFLTGNQAITLSGDISGSGTTAITTAIGSAKVINSMLAGSITASKLVGTDIATVGTITSGTWQATPIANTYLANSSVTINSSSVSLGGSIDVGTVRTVTATAGTGVSISGSPITGASGALTITNTAPDQTVTISNGTGINVTSSYPSFTVAATGGLTAGTGITLSGSFPTYTVTNSSPSSGGTVTSVVARVGMVSNTITATGNLDVDTTVMSTRSWRQKAVDSLNAIIATKGNGSVTSVGLVAGDGITITGTSPITTSGTFTATATVTPSSTNTLTNKRITFRVITTANYTTSVTIDADTYDMYVITAQAGALLFNAPTGTPTEGQMLLVRIKDNGTARALTYNGIFRAGADVALPSTTTISKWLYLEFLYNNTDTKWDLVGKVDGF